jgi:hypothetical protein
MARMRIPAERSSITFIKAQLIVKLKTFNSDLTFSYRR